MSNNKKNFEDLQHLAEKVAEIYIDRPDPSPQEIVYDQELSSKNQQELEKQQLLREAEEAMKRHLDEFKRSQRFLGSGYRFAAFIVVFAVFAALLFFVRLSFLGWPMKLGILLVLFAGGIFSLFRRRS